MAAVVQLKTMFKEFMDPTTDTAPEVLSRLLTHWGQISEVHICPHHEEAGANSTVYTNPRPEPGP